MTRLLAALAVSLALSGAAIAQPTIREAPPADDRAGGPPADRDPATTADRRPIYVAGGVLVLGAIFLWNRRRRAELDRQSETRSRDGRTAARAARGDREPGAGAAIEDADAADLRAAAQSVSNDEEPTP